MARVGLLSEKLYMRLASQNVILEDKPLDRPGIQHWETVLVRLQSYTGTSSHLRCTHEIGSRSCITPKMFGQGKISSTTCQVLRISWCNP